MGTFRIEIQSVGGHGCQREIRSGERVSGCGSPRCPDCIAREFVRKLIAAGCGFAEVHLPDSNHIQYARLTHWPGDQHSVIDDLITGVRAGNF